MNPDKDRNALKIGDWVAWRMDAGCVGEIVGEDPEGDIILRIFGEEFIEEDPPIWWANRSIKISEEEAMLRILEKS